MGHTVIGVFDHSGDADLAAAHLRDEYTLAADELDVIGEAEWDNLTPPAPEGATAWLLASFSGGMVAGRGDEDPIGKRWGDRLWHGETLVVARSGDPEVAEAMASEMRRTGARRIDIMPH